MFIYRTVQFCKKYLNKLMAKNNLLRLSRWIVAWTFGLIYVYAIIFINSHGNSLNNGEHISSQFDIEVKRIGIIISCSYYENKNTLAATLSQMTSRSLPSIYKTLEAGYEYKLYIGIDLDDNIDQYRDLWKTLDLNISFLHTTKASYSDSINEIVHKHALNEDIDYFAVIQFDALLNWRYWTTRSVMSLKGHCPTDVGAVVQDCNEYNRLIVFGREHVESFSNIFPPKLKLHEIAPWLIDFYCPKHLSCLNSKSETDCNNQKNDTIKSVNLFNSNKAQEGILWKSNCVVSYSLYGNNKRYTDGALENMNLIKTIYPGWSMWIYHDLSVPQSLLDYLCKQSHVRCIDMSESKIGNKMVWRFLVATSLNVSRYVVRDIDSRLSMREKAAVNEWVYSGKLFHVMRDHPNHNYVINGGMWGGAGDMLLSLYVSALREKLNDSYLLDMRFLGKYIWPIVKQSVLQHDSFHCLQYGSRPFPTLRDNYDHVGNVFINGKVRKIDIKILKDHTEPKKCMPHVNILEKLVY